VKGNDNSGLKRGFVEGRWKRAANDTRMCVGEADRRVCEDFEDYPNQQMRRISGLWHTGGSDGIESVREKTSGMVGCESYAWPKRC
jgi:hypothetical protein